MSASHEKRRLEEEIAELKQRLENSSQRQAQLEGGDHDIVATLRQELEERSAEVDALRKRANREASITGEPARTTPLSPTSKNDLNSARGEIKGLKSVTDRLSDNFSLILATFRHIIQELQKESQTVKQQAKFMESENQLLMQETEQLRQVCRAFPIKWV